MRSTLLVFLSACGGVSSTSTCENQEVSYLLQLNKADVRKHAAQATDAKKLLESVQGVAKSLKKGSLATVTPDEVNAALATANTALQSMFPMLAEQHAMAQQEIEHGVAAVQACHSQHGGEVRARLEQAVTTELIRKEQCEESLSQAVEEEQSACEHSYEFVHDGHCASGYLGENTRQDSLSACSAHCNSVEGCGFFAFCDGPTGCDGDLWGRQLGGGSVCLLYSEAGQCSDDNNWEAYNAYRVREANCLCDEARTAIADQTDLCAAVTETYEIVFCENHMACDMFHECHEGEMEVYNTLRADVEAVMVSRQQEYITFMQVECLMDLITNAMLTGTPIDDASLVGCDDVDVDGLTITFPEPPSAPAGCQLPQSGDLQCDTPVASLFAGLQNRDFEDFVITDARGYQYSQEIEGWQVSGNVIMITTGNGPWGSTNAASGNHFLGLQINRAVIKQTVGGHIVGRTYNLVVHVARRVRGGHDDSLSHSLRIAVNGIEIANWVVTNTEFEFRFVSYTADSATIEIELSNAGDDGDQTVFLDALDIISMD